MRLALFPLQRNPFLTFAALASATMADPSFMLRPYAPSDEDMAIELWRRTWQIVYPDIDFPSEWNGGGNAGTTSSCPRPISVAEANGQMLGFVTVDPHTFDLDQIVVAPEAWGTGVASALIEEAKRISPNGLDLHVNKDNVRAIRFYEKQGFVISGEAMNWRSGAPVHKMSWRPITS